MTQVSSLYLHVPFCRHLCNYCDFYKRSFDDPPKQIEEFHQFLTESRERNDQLMSGHGMTWGKLDTLYLGGGTPSLWGKEGAAFLSGSLLRDLDWEGAEFTMEVDPGTWTQEMIEAWKKIGLNRLSIGTQTLDANFLRIMDRAHSLEESQELLSFCQQENWNFSMDFLLGLPYSLERKRDIRRELESLLAYRPKHISLYILNARVHYPHTQGIPDDEFIREEYLLVSQFLRSEGFLHYEVSNFALPGFESRHNMKYWRSESVAALGPTGTGYLTRGENSALRYKWKVTRPEAELEELGDDEIALERTYLSLRTREGFRPQNPEKYLPIFRQWEKQGQGVFEENRMVLTPLGYVMLDSLMDDLFRAKL